MTPSKSLLPAALITALTLTLSTTTFTSASAPVKSTPTPTASTTPTAAAARTGTPTKTPTLSKAQGTPTKGPKAPSLQDLEAALVESTNATRLENGLEALTIDPVLVAVARERSKEMATKNYFAHTSSSGATAFTLLEKRDFFYRVGGENIARSNYQADQVEDIAFDMLMDSKEHRENILQEKFNFIGVGVAADKKGQMRYFTQLFSESNGKFSTLVDE